MSPVPAATGPRRPERLLVIDPAVRSVAHRAVDDLARHLAPGSVIVVNDSATLPAALFGQGPSGARVELRLASLAPDGRFDAIVFGDGDWRTPTERRTVPDLCPGDELTLAGGEVRAALAVVRERRVGGRLSSPRGDWLAALLRHGRPIQYSYVGRDLSAVEVQTPFAGRPWSMEMPCAARALSWRSVLDLRRRGVVVATLTHAAGISSTGDPDLDAELPLPERYAIPAATARAVVRAKGAGRPVVAVGTSALRALEAASRAGDSLEGEGVARLVIGPHTRLRIADGLVTSLHEPGTSHFDLQASLAPRDLLTAARESASERGYLAHEFGDLALVLPGAASNFCNWGEPGTTPAPCAA